MKNESRVLRYDYSEYKKTEVTSQGYLRADAFATRTGVFTYILGDGSMRRELRPPNEVFNPDSMKTLAAIVVTNDHPPVELNSENTAKFAVGYTHEGVKADESFLSIRVTITDKRTIDDIISKKKDQLSCGYYCDLELAPGIWEGEPYDAIQRNISYNHISVVDVGRAGPDVKIKMDAKDGVVLKKEAVNQKKPTQENKTLIESNLDSNPPSEAKPNPGVFSMAKMTIDGVEYEMPEGVAAVVAGKLSRLDKAESENKALQAEGDKIKGRLDGIEAENKSLKEAKEASEKARQDAKPSTSDLVKIGKARVELEAIGKSAGLDQSKLDSMEDLEVKKEIVKKLMPSVSLDGKSADYVEAIFDTQKASLLSKDGSFNSDADSVLGKAIAKTDGAPTAGSSREAMMKRSKDAWKQGLAAGK